MKRSIIAVMSVVVLLGLAETARADSAIAYVGTVNASNAFTVQDGGNQLYYHPQPDTDYVWMNNNGSPPGTIATNTWPTNKGGDGTTLYNRDGMKTFACSDVAYGQAINTVQMSFDYNTGTDSTTGLAMSSPSMNFFLTDGLGHYGIWSATSGTARYTDTPIEGTDWVTRTLDCTTIADGDSIAVYEHNGFSGDYIEPYTTFNWADVKNFSLAGFYDYQRTPEGGFEAWGQTLWTDITNVADPMVDTTLNEYGITINWGDTAGGMYADGSGEIGSAADRSYGQAGRMIRNLEITVGETAYEMGFEPGVVPEPSTMALLAVAALGAIAFLRRRHRR